MQVAKSCKVLVVEDEGLIALDIASRLQALGHEIVATVGTGEEAIEQAAGADIVLMDVTLDGRMDGIEAAAEIRKRYHVPVVFLTARADRATFDRAKLTGPFGYLVKPLAHATLHTSIELAIYKHRLERWLEEREAWLRTTLNSMPEGIVVTDVAGRVVMLNPTAEALTGWHQHDAEGQTVCQVVRLVDGDSGEPVESPVPLALLLDSPVPFDRNWQVVARSGRQVAIGGSVAPVQSSGDPLGTVFTLREVSAQRWEERQLRQSQKMEAVGRLAAGVSNDYSNLLAIIRTRADELLQKFGEYSPARRSVEEIHQAAVSAEQITRRLAGLGEIQIMQPEILSMNGMIRRMSKLIASVAGDGIELIVRLDPATSKIKADAAEIEQAIMNVVTYARSTMPSGGKLLLETRNAEVPALGKMYHHVLLSVSYSGQGTGPQNPDPDNLFEPASTGDAGLALSVVHNIVTAHGGYVSAQTTPDGNCRLGIYLPRWNEGVLITRPAGAEEAPSILMVDCRERVRLQLHNFFEANGYNVLEAADAEEAVALGLVHEGALDLLIAGAAQADSIAANLRHDHPGVLVLRIVDAREESPNEIRFPFTQAALLDRVAALLTPNVKQKSAAG